MTLDKEGWRGAELWGGSGEAYGEEEHVARGAVVSGGKQGNEKGWHVEQGRCDEGQMSKGWGHWGWEERNERRMEGLGARSQE